MAGESERGPRGQRDEGSASWRSGEALRLAEEITEELFQGSEGRKGDRLLLITPGGEKLARWGRRAVCALIATILDAEGGARRD